MCGALQELTQQLNQIHGQQREESARRQSIGGELHSRPSGGHSAAGQEQEQVVEQMQPLVQVQPQPTVIGSVLAVALPNRAAEHDKASLAGDPDPQLTGSMGLMCLQMVQARDAQAQVVRQQSLTCHAGRSASSIHPPQTASTS